MVFLHIKRGDDSQFLFETKLDQKIEKVQQEILTIFNGRLKIHRICSEIEELASHGTALPANMVGLTDEQIVELKLKDEYASICVPSGGYIFNEDPCKRRNGQQPNDKMQELLKKTCDEAKQMVGKKLVETGKCLVVKEIQEALNILKGAVRIVYPMDIPGYDPIKMEFMNIEDLAGTHASLQVIEPSRCQLWFAGRQLLPEKELRDFLGGNEKSKVIIKIAKREERPPGREPAVTEEMKKHMMMMAYRRQEELKKLELDEDDSYLDAKWADNKQMQRTVHGVDMVKFKFGK